MNAPINLPADPDPSRELLHIVDEIEEVRLLLDAVFMAAETLADEEKNPIHAVLNVADRMLKAASGRLNVARGATAEEVANA